ncbi:MAG: RNA polymerase sigma factor [Sphingomonadales bacterium]|nr:MAG: RNA polymerase sigma factor [Sphingomonadales bacterium]
MERHREAVYRIVRGHVGDAEEALDVTQASFVSAFAALRRYDRARPFRAWLVRIALNKCHDWARRKRVRRFLAYALPFGVAEDMADSAPGTETEVADREALSRAMTAIAALPDTLKEPLLLHAVEGWSQAETASILGISAKAVETRIYRARTKLSEMLRD